LTIPAQLIFVELLVLKIKSHFKIMMCNLTCVIVGDKYDNQIKFSLLINNFKIAATLVRHHSSEDVPLTHFSQFRVARQFMTFIHHL
jgi:hypothetical protein